VSSRTFQPSKGRDLYGPGVYTQSPPNPTVFRPLFYRVWSLPVPKSGRHGGAVPKKSGPFPVVYSRYPDRSRVGIEDSHVNRRFEIDTLIGGFR
jgi:hypothetical protein